MATIVVLALFAVAAYSALDWSSNTSDTVAEPTSGADESAADIATGQRDIAERYADAEQRLSFSVDAGATKYKVQRDSGLDQAARIELERVESGEVRLQSTSDRLSTSAYSKDGIGFKVLHLTFPDERMEAFLENVETETGEDEFVHYDATCPSNTLGYAVRVADSHLTTVHACRQ